jgi:hypothetical protein
MELMNLSRTLLSTTVLVLSVAVAAQAVPPIPAFVPVQEGDTVGTGTVTAVNAPFTDGNGKLGLVGVLNDDQRFIWWDTGPVFFSGDALPDVLTGGESTMGVSNTGGFVYSPSFNGDDAAYSHDGVLLVDGDPAPGFPDQFSSFNSRPSMLPDGTAHWISGLSDTAGGSSQGRTIYRLTDTTQPGLATPLLATGQMIDGQTIDTGGVDFDYNFSDDGLNHIHVLDMVGDTGTDGFVYLNGALIAREGDPNGSGDNWDNFDVVDVNIAGNYVFSGDTDGATGSDEFVAYNSVISIREGDTVDGVLLDTGSSVRALSINDLNQVVQIWGSGSGASAVEYLFFGDAADMGNSELLLQLGDELDVDGDEIADYFVLDFNASGTIGPGLDLAEDGFVHVELDLVPIGGTEDDQFEAIVRIVVPEPTTLCLLGLSTLALLRRRS